MLKLWWNSSRQLFTFGMKDLRLILRRVNEYDLLGVSTYTPLFVLKEELDNLKSEQEVDPVKQICVTMHKNTKEYIDNELRAREDRKYLVKRCIVRMRTELSKDIVDSLMADDDVIRAIYKVLIIKSIRFKFLQAVSKHQARNIYNVYKGLNFAEQYFGQGVLTKLEEFSFNALIHNVGVEQDNENLERMRRNGKR